MQERRQDLDQECYVTLGQAYRRNTLRNLRSQALIYHRFCVYYGLQPFPASEWQMVRFARYLGNSVTSVETVKNYISGIRTLHSIAGYKTTNTLGPNLTLMIRALKFELAHAVKQAKPMTPRLLFKIYQIIDLSDLTDIIAFAALVIGFYLFLRASNLVPASTGEFKPGEQLTRGDLRCYKGYTMIDVKWSKTIQYKQKINSLPLIPARRKEICPQFWAEVVKTMPNDGPGAPLFSYRTSRGSHILTYSQLSRKLKSWVAECGENPTEHSLHGLR